MKIEIYDYRYEFFSNNNDIVATVQMEDDNYIGTMYIEPEFRGKGFYKKVLKALIQECGYDHLYSNNRNDNNNCIYERWLNKELDTSDEILIEVESDNVVFCLI